MRKTLIIILLLTASPCFATPQVVVSLAPLHSLVSSLTRGLYRPQLLLPQGGSPHNSSLRPSQARAMASADLLIWVGPELESFLTQPIARLVPAEKELRLLALSSLQRLPQRQGGFWDQDQHDAESGPEPDPVSQQFNPHLWLSPLNARLIATVVTARLTRLDPQNQRVYQRNLADLTKRITALEERLHKQLQPLKNRPYLVFHDAYPYFEKAFSLDAIGSIRISAERAPGARRLQQVHNKIAETQAICLFSEPQFNPALAQKLAAGSAMRLGVLDPLGRRVDKPEDAWFVMMNDLAKNLKSCLEGEKQ